MNSIYKYFFFEQDIQKYSEVVNLVRAIPDDADIVYVGESSNHTFRSNDIDKRKISGFVADYFKNLKVYDITKPASHAGIYKTLLENIPESSNVSTVVVTLNMRSFNSGWIHSKLETSLQKSMVLLRDNPPLINRFLLSFKAYDKKSDKQRSAQVKRDWKNSTLTFPYEVPYKNIVEWNEFFAKKGVLDSKGKKDEKKTQLACSYIKTYAFQIDTNSNVRIKDFDDIIILAKKRGWNIVFNLLAENTEKAQQLVGDNLIYLMEHNREVLVKYFSNKGVLIADNFNVVHNEEFIDQNWTTEHYAEKGRRIVAKNVAEQLKILYPEEYEEVKNIVKKESVFFNDCENQNNVWGNMHTISDEQSFSGKYSSKIDRENKYGIGFVYPLINVVDTLKNSMNISFKTLKYSNDDNAKLVVEFLKDNVKCFWNGIPLKTQVNGVNEWEEFSYTQDISEKNKDADLVKVYVLNNSNDIVFVDDFKVVFK